MKKIPTGLIVTGVLVIVLIALGGWYVSARNGFVDLDETVKEQWAKVEVQYQRRLDLIPNLVATVKGYAEHESKTFENVTRARAGLETAKDAAKTDPSVQTYEQFDRALGLYINAVHEAYPDLKADTQFLDLQKQLEGTENRIATERGRYTEAVKKYNYAVRKFPGSIVASFSGFTPKEQFQAQSGAENAPQVSF